MPETGSAEEQQAREQSTEEAHTIQVTIGRIEVRALAATEAPSKNSRRERKAPSLMSLDDYLRQRARGGQR
jgi:hypothetical protein